MGAIVRQYIGNKIEELFRDEIENHDVIVWISGGIAEVCKNQDASVMIIDLDNLSDEFTSSTITKEKALEYGVSYE